MSKKSHHRITQDTAARAATIRAQTADSFTNLAARVGMGANNQHSASTYSDQRISSNRRLLEAAYKTSWVCGAVVDMPAQDMTRAGVEFTAGEMPSEESDKLLRAMETLKIWDRVGAGIKWSRLFGGAIAVMLIDGQDNSTPLRTDTIAEGQFKGLLVLDRWQVDPSLNNLVDEFGPDLGYPKFYNVLSGARALGGQKIHYSRVVRLEGVELPYEQQIAENGWGQSVLERLWDRLISFDSTTAGVAQLVYKAHLRTIQIEKLREILASGNAKAIEGLAAQMNFIRQYQSNEGLTVLDATDKFEAHSYTFAGLDNVLLQMGQQLSGASQIPLVRLFGQSPAGLNSTGDSDLRTYYDGIKQAQETTLRTPLGRLLAVMNRSVNKKPLPEGFAWEFVSLWQMTPEQKANVAKTKGEAVAAAYDSGIIDQPTAMRELRQASHETGVFTHITEAQIDEADANPPAPVETELEVDPLAAPGTVPPALAIVPPADNLEADPLTAAA